MYGGYRRLDRHYDARSLSQAWLWGGVDARRLDRGRPAWLHERRSAFWSAQRSSVQTYRLSTRMLASHVCEGSLRLAVCRPRVPLGRETASGPQHTLSPRYSTCLSTLLD